MEWNAESVLDALNDFERKPELSPILEEYLQRIAKNGEIIFPWCKLKPLLKKKLEVVLDEFYETCPVETSVPVPNFETFNFDNLKKTILQAVDAFASAPFTIQRLCELVTNPQKHYNRTDKYMRGIEKNVLVVSTIEPRTGGQADGNNANNIVIVNGMINDSPRDENDTLNGHENESADSVSSTNMNTPSNHVLLENFANVFPSAACIPSASNICINREIDGNFVSTSECEDTSEEVDFEAIPTVEPPTETTVKEEAMDISEEHVPANAEAEKVETTAEESSDSSELSETEEKRSEKDFPESDVDNNANSSEMSEISATEEEKVKDDYSEVTESVPPEEEEEVKFYDLCHKDASIDNVHPGEEEEIKFHDLCQQDDTVSQSDDSSCDNTNLPENEESVDANDSGASVKSELIAEKIIIESVTNVEEETVDNDAHSSTLSETESSELNMELESDKNSDPPPE